MPATDEESQEEEVEPEATAEDEIETPATPTASGLTAVIVSGDSAGAGMPFTFDATQSQSAVAPIVGYVWGLGDGTTLFGVSVEHAYTEPGFYTVTLIVTDKNGEIDTAAKVVEIIDLAAEATPTAESQFSLVGTTWEMNNAIRGTSVILKFDEGKLSGSAGCNDYKANYFYTVNEDGTIGISVSSISMTNNSCVLEIMAQERGYLESLASASRLIIDGAKLTLETGSGSLTFTLVPE